MILRLKREGKEEHMKVKRVWDYLLHTLEGGVWKGGQY